MLPKYNNQNVKLPNKNYAKYEISITESKIGDLIYSNCVEPSFIVNPL